MKNEKNSFYTLLGILSSIKTQEFLDNVEIGKNIFELSTIPEFFLEDVNYHEFINEPEMSIKMFHYNPPVFVIEQNNNKTAKIIDDTNFIDELEKYIEIMKQFAKNEKFKECIDFFNKWINEEVKYNKKLNNMER